MKTDFVSYPQITQIFVPDSFLNLRESTKSVDSYV